MATTTAMAPEVELTISLSRERKMTPNVRKMTAIEILEAQSTTGLMRAARGSERLLMMIPRTRGIRIMTTRLAMTERGLAWAPSRMKGTKNGVRITVIMVRMMDSETARATLPPVNCATFAVDGAPAAMLMRSRPGRQLRVHGNEDDQGDCNQGHEDEICKERETEEPLVVQRCDQVPDGHHETGEEHARKNKDIDGNSAQVVEERGHSGVTCMNRCVRISIRISGSYREEHRIP